MRIFVTLSLILACLTPRPAQATPSPFSQGRWRVSIAGGGSLYGGDRYWVIGAGVGHFIADGLEVGAEVEQWLGDRSITKLSPQIRYVLFLGQVNPYLGVFYRHWFISDREDWDTAGGRAGVVYTTGRRAHIGIGITYERVVSQCALNCETVYPDLTLAVSF